MRPLNDSLVPDHPLMPERPYTSAHFVTIVPRIESCSEKVRDFF